MPSSWDLRVGGARQVEFWSGSSSQGPHDSARKSASGSEAGCLGWKEDRETSVSLSAECPAPYLAAAVQLRSTSDVERNFTTAEGLLREAALSGARLVALPEHFGYLRAEGQPNPYPQSPDGPWISRLAGLAKELGVTLVAGTLAEEIPGEALNYNTAFVISPDGRLAARYRKIHLFDPALPELGSLKESATTKPGSETVVCSTPCGELGLAICYDIRFPELFRQLVQGGADVFVTPSAFTARTGADHWEVLLRARAIENLSYVIAPAQWGRHEAERTSHGHSMIVDPWGRVLDCLPDGEGLAMAEIDIAKVHEHRHRLPCLDHARLTGTAWKDLTGKGKVG
jgi:predicted amidohydrolase